MKSNVRFDCYGWVTHRSWRVPDVDQMEFYIRLFANLFSYVSYKAIIFFLQSFYLITVTHELYRV